MNPKGAKTTMNPITNLKDIDKIKKILAGKPRDLCIFSLGINVALRGSDLLALTVGQVRYLKADDTLRVTEMKTGKSREIMLNTSAVDAIQALLATMPGVQDSELLFRSQKPQARKATARVNKKGEEVVRQPLERQITIQTLNRLVKEWCDICKEPNANYGSHSLRKTWAYQQRVKYKVELPVLMEVLGHSSQAMTLKYICVQPEEIKNVYRNCL
jgi:integrase